MNQRTYAIAVTDQIVLNLVVCEAVPSKQDWVNEKNRNAYKQLKVLVPGNYENPMCTLGHVPAKDFTVGLHSSNSHLVIELLPGINKYRAGGAPGIVHQYDRHESLGKALRTQLQAAKDQKYGYGPKEKKDV